MAIFYLVHSVHPAIKIGNFISNLYNPHRSLHIISKSYIYYSRSLATEMTPGLHIPQLCHQQQEHRYSVS